MNKITHDIATMLKVDLATAWRVQRRLHGTYFDFSEGTRKELKDAAAVAFASLPPPPPAVVVPELEHDRMMLGRFGTNVGPRGKLERRIVAALVAHLDRAGFVPFRTYDGECFERCHDAKSAMEFIFNLDEVSLRFVPKNVAGAVDLESIEHGVLLVLGEGLEIISDWNYDDGDADKFNASMEAFDVEDFA